MKNTNALQIFSILSFLVIIVLVVVLIMFNNSSQQQIDQMNDAVAKAAEAKKNMEEAKAAMLTLKELIGHGDEVDIATIQETFNKDMERYANGESPNYKQALASLNQELNRKNSEHDKTVKSFNDLQVNFNNLNEMYRTIVDKFSEEQRQAIDDLTKERDKYAETNAANRQKMDEIKSTADEAREDAERKIKEAEAKQQEAEIARNQIAVRNKEVSDTLAEIRKDSYQDPDGKIISVNQRTRLAVINLGADDGLRPRMTFSVYDPSVTGITLGSATEGHAAICDICKREASLRASKASVEVTRILGPHRAEVRILDDRVSNPIVINDVIHTPIWRPGENLRFALAGTMNIPGLGARDGVTNQSNLQDVINLIRMNGGVVDAYISDGLQADQKPGERIGEITKDTHYLVIGDVTDSGDNLDRDAMNAIGSMKKTAEQLAIKQIPLRDLLSMMRFRNSNQSRGFGDFARDIDQNVVSDRIRQPSTGTVSPIHGTPNHKAGITNADRRATARRSPGAVTGFYGDAAPPAKGTGSVSDLFRTRQPGASRSTIDADSTKTSVSDE